MEFIYEESMGEYQAYKGGMEFMIPEESYDEKRCALAERILTVYSEKLEEIAEGLSESEEFKEYYPGLKKTEIMLRLGKPSIMLESAENGKTAGTISYFENKIDENEVIQVEFEEELMLQF